MGKGHFCRCCSKTLVLYFKISTTNINQDLMLGIIFVSGTRGVLLIWKEILEFLWNYLNYFSEVSWITIWISTILDADSLAWRTSKDLKEVQRLKLIWHLGVRNVRFYVRGYTQVYQICQILRGKNRNSRRQIFYRKKRSTLDIIF